MKRIARLAGRLLCLLRWHRWKQVGVKMHFVPFGAVLCPVRQCQRCGWGCTSSPCCGEEWMSPEKMIDVLTEMEVRQIEDEVLQRQANEGEEWKS